MHENRVEKSKPHEQLIEDLCLIFSKDFNVLPTQNLSIISQDCVSLLQESGQKKHFSHRFSHKRQCSKIINQPFVEN